MAFAGGHNVILMLFPQFKGKNIKKKKKYLQNIMYLDFDADLWIIDLKFVSGIALKNLMIISKDVVIAEGHIFTPMHFSTF